MDVQQLRLNIEQDYYNHVTPEESINKDTLPSVAIKGAELEYFELEIGGRNFLCIKTPVAVLNGPGKRYVASLKG